jgi:hypothetical protein
MAEERFYCTSCGQEYEGDVTTHPASACRVCFRIHCDECLDEDGNCVPCVEVGKQKKT